jgi:hypothetical protein
MPLLYIRTCNVEEGTFRLRPRENWVQKKGGLSRESGAYKRAFDAQLAVFTAKPPNG